MKRRKICVITGTRAEFGLLKPVMEKIRESGTLELQVIVTGMHLLPEYGDTVSELFKNGIPINASVPMIVSGDDKTTMSLSIGLGIISFTHTLDQLNPDVVLLLGDRYEIFSAAIAASFTGRIVAHISGGDSLRAGYDEYVRHAITKISHIHFPSTKLSAERIIKMGENPKRVFIVGSTALDTILNEKIPSERELCMNYGLSIGTPFALVIQHPVSTEPELAQNQMEITLDSILEIGLKMLVIYPNADPGGKKIIQTIDKYKVKYPEKISAYQNIPFEDYLGIMKIASVIIGNSSSGIIESPSFQLPAVNIGDRQMGRERACNVIDVPHEREQIKKGIMKALNEGKFRDALLTCTNPYGKGDASKKIVKILSTIDLGDDIIKKKITY